MSLPLPGLRSGTLPDLRSTRMEGEWGLACELQNANARTITKLSKCGSSFLLSLSDSPAIVLRNGKPEIVCEHDVCFEFPRYYPTLPIETYLSIPVFHPNVNPVSGFVCLWDQRSSGDTIVEAVVQLRKVMSWELFNGSSEHLMQPKAVEMTEAGTLGLDVPLASGRLVMPEGWMQLRRYPLVARRRRLTAFAG